MGARSRALRGGRRPALELLECRQLLSLTVNTFADVVDAGDSYLSLREAVAQAAANPGADTVVLPHMIDSVEGSYVLSLGEIAIDDAGPLTIESDGGAATVDAQGWSRVFSVAAGSVVDLEGLVVTGGHAADYGGGLFNQGSVTIANSLFLANAADLAGGGVYADLSSTTAIDGVGFESNEAGTYDGADYAVGGAVFNAGEMAVTGSTFSSNAAHSGAGIENVATLDLSDSTFNGNVASSGLYLALGGGVENNGTATVTDVEFTGNTADNHGGGLSNSAAASLTGCTFTGNSASSLSVQGGRGGGLYNNGTMSVDDSIFSGNSATIDGGGFYNDYAGSATISDSTLSDNSAIYNGGGLYNYGTLAITDATLSGNTANYSGGGLYNYGTLAITDTTLSGNSANSGYGGGVYNNTGTVIVANSTLTSNTAGDSGGGVYNLFAALTVVDSTLSGNSASYHGGGIYSSGTVSVTNSTLTSNTAGWLGGGVSNNGTMTVADSTFTGNSAGVHGGAVYSIYSYATTVAGSTFHSNSAPDAVLYYIGSYGTITGNTITGNTAAGVSVMDFGSVTITGNVINSNTGLAIDLGGDGRTANDPGDYDYGPNNLQNYPIITGFDVGAATHVTGKLNSTPYTTFTIDLYADSATAPLNPGESTRYLGSVLVTTDAAGNASFDVVLDAATAAGEIVTATATDPYGNTSEFSDLNYVSVTPATGLYTSESGAAASFSVVLTSRPTSIVLIPLSSSDTTEGVVSPPLLSFTPDNWNVPQVVTVTGRDDSVADGPIAYTVVFGAALSNDPIFNGMDGDDVPVTNFDNDIGPMEAVEPAGSLIYIKSLDGAITTAGGVETYMFRVAPGQTISVDVEPEGTDLRAKVQLFRHGGANVIASATAGEAGQDAVLQTFATPGQLGGNGSGPVTYVIRVTGVDQTTGRYRIHVVLNAAGEDEWRDGESNDTRADAQSLEPSFLPFDGPANASPSGSAAGRGAVLGRTDDSTPDYYAVKLAKGASLTAALTGQSYGDLSLTLENSAGTDLAAGWFDGSSPSLRINNFVAPKAGTYYLRVAGYDPYGTEYSLVVTRNADFDSGVNDSVDTAQDLISSEASGKRWALGTVEPGSSYVTSARNYTFEDVSATGHAILQGSDDGAEFLDSSVLDGFQFTLGGVTSTSLYVNANGSLYLPASYQYIFAMARDLVIFGAADAAVYWQVLGTGDQQRLVVQWNNVGFYGYSNQDPNTPDADPITFQVVLSEADGSIQFNYKDLQTDVPYYNEGLDSTVGISGYDSSWNYFSHILDTYDAPNQFVGTGRSTRISQEPLSDFYRITADAGSTLRIETLTPASQSGGFVNNLDPIVRLYDSAGNLVASNDNGAADRRNARLSYQVPKGKGGTYTIQVSASPATAAPTSGEYVLSVKNATVDLPVFQVAGTDVPDGAVYRFPPSSIWVDFNDGVLLTSLQASDLTVDGVSATGFTLVDGNTVIFDLPGDLPDGLHTVTIAAGAIQDLQGTNIEAFATHFTSDKTPPRVIGSSIQQGDVLAPGDLTYTVTFSEPMTPYYYNFYLTGQFQGYFSPIDLSFDAAGTTLTVQYSGLPEDNYTFMLYGYGFFDLAGNPLDGEPVAWPIPPNESGDGVEGGDFYVSFSVDADTTPFPTPLIAEPPVGSLVYEGNLFGVVNFADDTDSFTVALDAGQTLTVIATGLWGLQPTVEVRDHTGALIGSAAAADVEAVLQTVAIAGDDVYTVTVGGAAGTSGAFDLRLILNAAVELESNGGPGNNSVAEAQDIDGSFTDLIKGATRGAVLGTLGGSDVYSFSLQAGQALSADLAVATPPSIFGPRTDYYEDVPTWATLGDVNNDDKLDMVAGSAYGYLTVRLGNGDGTFGDPAAFGFGSAFPWQVEMDDLNGDGNLDVVSSNFDGDSNGTGGVTVMLGHGDGTFDPAVGYFGGYYNAGLALGDVNGDGAPDVVVTSVNDDSIHVLLNNGDGSLAAAVVYAVGGDPYSVALGDFDGDDALDIVTSNAYDISGNLVTVLLNNGDGTFGTGITYLPGDFASAVAVGDVDGDHALDIAVTDINNNTVTVLLNHGDGTFAAGVSHALSNNGIVAVVLGDVDGDGSLDIVAGAFFNSSYSGGGVSVLLNDGAGNFGPEVTTDTPIYLYSVALGDLDGDGRLDLVTANWSSYNLSVFLNQSAPTTLELIGPDGVTVLATATLDDVHAAFSNFIAPETGTYYLRVSGPSGATPYTLLATRDAVIDLGGNDTTATAQPLGPVHVALGAVGTPDDPADVYSFTAAAGESVHLFTTTPGDGPGEFTNTLNPHIRVFNALGVLVAEGVALADGRNEDLVFVAGDAGTYFVEVSAEDGTSGEYILDPSPVDAAPAPTASLPALPSDAASTPVLGQSLTAFANPSASPATNLGVLKAPAPAPVGASPRSSSASVPPQVGTPVNRIAASAGVSGTISIPSVLVGPRPDRFTSVLGAFRRGPRLPGKIDGGEEHPAGLFGSVAERDAFPSEGIGSEAECVRPDETALALAWDACLDDEAWSASMAEPGEQALIAAAAGVAAIGLYAHRRRDAKRVAPRLNSAWPLPVNPRGE